MFNEKKIKYLVGNKKINIKIYEPFSKLGLEFFGQISKKIFNDKKSREYKDLISFAFWSRKKNLDNLKNIFVDKNLRLGLGNIFHLTPSNVPIAFIYSFVFGILSGLTSYWVIIFLL